MHKVESNKKNFLFKIVLFSKFYFQKYLTGFENLLGLSENEYMNCFQKKEICS